MEQILTADGKAALVLPQIHSNGTQPGPLAQEYLAAWRAVQNVQKALEGCAPHGRDYYPADGGEVCGPSFEAARRQHEARVHKLCEVGAELWSLAHYCTNKANEKKARDAR